VYPVARSLHQQRNYVILYDTIYPIPLPASKLHRCPNVASVSRTVTPQLIFPTCLHEVRSNSPSTYTGHVLQMIWGILKQIFCVFQLNKQNQPVPVFRLKEPFRWTRSYVSVTSLAEELFETLDFVWKCTHKEAATWNLQQTCPINENGLQAGRWNRTCLCKEWIFFNSFRTCLPEIDPTTREDRN